MSDVAIITGGTGSIGAAICEVLSSQGWTCVAADLVEPPPGTLPWEFEHVDVSSTASVDTLIGRASSLGKIRALVNAHGILRETLWNDESDENVEAILDVNLKGVFRVTRAVAMMMADGGSIVNLSSVTATMGRTRNAYVYQATKAGIESFTRTMAIELAPRVIRVNCVAPGYLSEPMRGEGAALRAQQGGNEALAQLTPFSRLVTPMEVATAIGFLCSPSASGISGVVLPVDGGQRAY